MVVLELGIAHHNNKGTQEEGLRGGERPCNVVGEWPDREATVPPVIAAGTGTTLHG